VWFPDEPICTLDTFKDLPWILRQREIQKLKISPSYCFTKKMLESLSSVDDTIKGLDPDTAGRTPGRTRAKKKN